MVLSRENFIYMPSFYIIVQTRSTFPSFLRFIVLQVMQFFSFYSFLPTSSLLLVQTIILGKLIYFNTVGVFLFWVALSLLLWSSFCYLYHGLEPMDVILLCMCVYVYVCVYVCMCVHSFVQISFLVISLSTHRISCCMRNVFLCRSFSIHTTDPNIVCLY